MDFQKRLERLKERKQQEEQQHQLEDPNPRTISNNDNDVKRTNVTKMERAPVEPLIVNHVAAIDESEVYDEFDDR